MLESKRDLARAERKVLTLERGIQDMESRSGEFDRFWNMVSINFKSLRQFLSQTKGGSNNDLFRRFPLLSLPSLADSLLLSSYLLYY